MDFNKRIRDQLILDEGIKYEIYKDTEGKFTFGIGHLIVDTDPEYCNLKNWSPDNPTKVTPARVEEAYAKDRDICLKSCQQVFNDFEVWQDELKLIIISMMFNLGIKRFKKFIRFILALRAKDYLRAAEEMEKSLWYSQTKLRAQRLQKSMLKLANKNE